MSGALAKIKQTDHRADMLEMDRKGTKVCKISIIAYRTVQNAYHEG
jgi:hypothetical protein